MRNVEVVGGLRGGVCGWLRLKTRVGGSGCAKSTGMGLRCKPGHGHQWPSFDVNMVPVHSVTGDATDRGTIIYADT